MSSQIQQKFNDFLFNRSFGAAILCHLLVFSLLSFYFKAPWVTPANIEVTFLGALLDPSEIVKSQKQIYFSKQEVDSIISGNTTGFAAAITKPNFSRAINKNNHKIPFKLQPESAAEPSNPSRDNTTAATLDNRTNNRGSGHDPH